MQLSELVLIRNTIELPRPARSSRGVLGRLRAPALDLADRLVDLERRRSVQECRQRTGGPGLGAVAVGQQRPRRAQPADLKPVVGGVRHRTDQDAAGLGDGRAAGDRAEPARLVQVVDRLVQQALNPLQVVGAGPRQPLDRRERE